MDEEQGAASLVADALAWGAAPGADLHLCLGSRDPARRALRLSYVDSFRARAARGYARTLCARALYDPSDPGYMWRPQPLLLGSQEPRWGLAPEGLDPYLGSTSMAHPWMGLD